MCIFTGNSCVLFFKYTHIATSENGYPVTQPEQDPQNNQVNFGVGGKPQIHQKIQPCQLLRVFGLMHGKMFFNFGQTIATKQFSCMTTCPAIHFGHHHDQ